MYTFKKITICEFYLEIQGLNIYTQLVFSEGNFTNNTEISGREGYSSCGHRRINRAGLLLECLRNKAGLLALPAE